MSFALRHALPTASDRVGSTAVGCCTTGPLYRRAASYHVDRILRGAKPGDIPFEGPRVFNLIVNRTTTRALGLTIPPDLSAQVTEWVD
jgi:putative tryptophan/tyrosine transport system substrate-binding protein